LDLIVLADTWLFDLARAKWSLVESDNAPQGRTWSQLAAAEAADGSKRIYMVGGAVGGAFRFRCG